MLLRIVFFVSFFILLHEYTQGQTFLKGKVSRADNESLLTGASIVNIKNNKTASSNTYGLYSIIATNGDTVLFSYLGLRTDTVVVESQLLQTGYDAYLAEKTTTLETVTVTNSYQSDSLRRREDYSNIYEKQPGITGGNTPANGVGIVLSPGSFFSSDTKQKKHLKKHLKKQEEAAYIDYMFPAAWVSKVTGLTGDTLAQFMYQYRPSYKFCREHEHTGLTIYVSEKIKEFRKPNH